MEERIPVHIQYVEWGQLKLHVERGGVFSLDPEVELLDVANAIADDDAARIRALLADNALTAVEEDTHAANDHVFRFAIVQPYVVIQGPLEGVDPDAVSEEE
ncbi:MAG: hypothetical protein ACI81R_003777 [Bradymonadia bacterium]|jgi:hypothetical protein